MPLGPLKTALDLVNSEPRYRDVARQWAFLDTGHSLNQMALFPLLTLLQPRVVCEVGSWMGASARFFAQFHSVEEVYCVDHWDRNLVENWYPGRHPEDWMDFMFEHFLANCIHSNLGHKIIPVRFESIAGAQYLASLKAQFDLIYIDGAHRTVIVRQDLRNFYPLLKPRGLFCGDDWVFNQEPENVQLAVTEFFQERKLQGYAAGNLWWCLPVG
jgi:predicted O-methyltransferase YrrM